MKTKLKSGRIISKLYDPALFLFRIFIDFVYPPYCLTCKRSLPDSHELICRACWDSQTNLDPCYLPAARLPSPPNRELHLEGSLAVYTYSEITQEIVHLFKYRKYEKLAEPFSAAMSRVLQDNDLTQFDGIVPVPLHKKRLKERGFNQAELMAARIGEQFDIELLNVLMRIRYTQPQAKMNRQERAANVLGAFAVKEGAHVEGKRLILVDDVMTTGSTLNECARLLKEAGASAIIALTIARA